MYEKPCYIIHVHTCDAVNIGILVRSVVSPVCVVLI